MYNEQLAEKIVTYLNSAFPDKVQLDDLKAAIPEFSALPDEEWLRALDALDREGRVEFKALRTGFRDSLQMAANIIISNSERGRLRQNTTKRVILPSPIIVDAGSNTD